MSNIINYNPHRRLEALVSSASSRQIYKTLVLSLFLICLSFVLLPTIIASANATTEVNTAVSWSPVSLSLDTDYGNGSIGNAGHGDISFSVAAPSSVGNGNLGTQVVSKKTIAVETTGKYYAVYLSTGKNDADLTLSGSNLKIEGMSGTMASPTSFTGASWGFAVPSTSNFSTPFSSDSVYANYDSILGDFLTKSSSAFYNTGTWASVPTLDEGAKLIQSATTTNPSGFGGENGDKDKSHFDVYYSVIVDNSFVAGSYSNSVIYTALASGGDLDSTSNNIARNLRYGTGGDTEKLSFDLAASVPTIDQSLVSVYLVPHSVTEANKDASSGEYTTTGLSAYATNTYKCPIASFALSNNKAELECTLPTNPDGKTAGGSSMDGEYDFWVHIDTYNCNYVSRYKEDNAEVASFAYAGLQTKKRNGTDYVFTKMQDMTASICKNTNMWGNQIGSDARAYDYTGTGAPLKSSSESSDILGFGTFALIDNRDNKTYLVRRLADGNCWMVQNLDLDLTVAANRILDPSTSDVTERRVLSEKNLLTEIGSTCSMQYQTYDAAGENCKWGSTKDGISVTNNADSAFARSYSNTVNGNPRYTAIQQLNGRYDQYGDSTDGINVNSGLTVPTSSGDTPTEVIKSGNARGYYGLMHIGTYYNWYAATAETGEYETTDQTLSDSICARGWQLPNGVANDEANAASSLNLDKSWTKLLKNTTNGYGLLTIDGDGNSTAATDMHKLPLTIPFAGYYDWIDGKLDDRGNYGLYWSGTATTSTTSVRGLYFTSSMVWSQASNGKTTGLTIRCVAR